MRVVQLLHPRGGQQPGQRHVPLVETHVHPGSVFSVFSPRPSEEVRDGGNERAFLTGGQTGKGSWGGFVLQGEFSNLHMLVNATLGIEGTSLFELTSDSKSRTVSRKAFFVGTSHLLLLLSNACVYLCTFTLSICASH